ncbi:MAG: amino acid decarboxylase, partial [Eubacterium sp.]|nr:amino acid decarboxylase [Eubacterium sp.]
MLHDDLKKLNKYPFHMPGHKRNGSLGINGCEIDITEINGYDNLHSPNGSILDIETRLSRLYNSSHSFMLINGSTVGILSAIFAVTERGDKIIIARNCHKSVYSACFLRELEVTFIEPEYDKTNGYYTYIKQSVIDEAIKNNPEAKAVVITSPTYEGNISNISTDIPLIIDCAHGAHFGFGSFPEYPKGDIVVSSLHKTLPSLTQTAVLNVYNRKFIDRVKMYLDIFETSSPSYVLMNSVSKCVEFLENSEEAFDKYNRNLDDFYKTKLNNLKFKVGADKGTIVVSTANCNISGRELAGILRNEFSIECEM